MDTTSKRHHDGELNAVSPPCKSMRSGGDDDLKERLGLLRTKSKRPLPWGTLSKITKEELNLIETIGSSCDDHDKVKAAIKIRKKYNINAKLPENLQDSSYYIKDGLRRVYPYTYIYQTYSKRRWFGRRLRDVIREEFRDISEEQMKWRFDNHMTWVNGEDAKWEYILKDNDTIANITHRHELPVLATPIKFIHRDKETVVIDKPPSLPIHPCGRYRHNSVVNLLQKEYNLSNLHVVHRLDRPVSGVLIFALNIGRANFLQGCIRDRDVLKEYVCRVSGEFPLGDAENDGEIVVDQPLEILAGKVGITVCMSGGKPSTTRFKRLSYNGKTSAVLCKPLTGRMHQIRVHLQYLGYPIINDALYNCDAFGPERGKGARYGKSLNQLSKDVLARHRASLWVLDDNTDILDETEIQTAQNDEKTSKNLHFVAPEEREEAREALAHYFTDESWKDLESNLTFDPAKYHTISSCRDCQKQYYDPPPRRLYLYLHALSYSGTGWSYKSEMPVWAKDTWKY